MTSLSFSLYLLQKREGDEDSARSICVALYLPSLALLMMLMLFSPDCHRAVVFSVCVVCVWCVCLFAKFEQIVFI